MQQYFPCHRCGAYNLVGSASCGNCRQQLYYSCPSCGTWVDNRYAYCPNCYRRLYWPGSTDCRYGQTRHMPIHSNAEGKKTGPWPAIVISLFIIGLIALIFTNPGSSSATKIDTTNAILQTVSTGIAIPDSQPKITVSSPNGQASPSLDPSQIEASSESSPAYLPTGVTLTTSSGEIIEIQMTDDASNSSNGVYTDSTGYTPKRSAYAQQIWPNWGHCSKGSCQGYTQP